ncbi:MAG: amidohydrolase, partial [Bacteroidetes bacterium]
AIRLNAQNQVERSEGIRYTIKDGIVYDAQKLLSDVEKMVEAARKKEGFELKQPGE